MLTIADEGGRGGPGTPDFGWRNMWTAPYDWSNDDDDADGEVDADFHLIDWQER